MDEAKQWKSNLSRWLSAENRRFLLIPALLLLGSYLLLGGGGAKGKAKPAENPAASEDFYAYEKELEQRLEELLSNVDGAGKTRVMVTLESTQMNVYAMDERDSMGGTEKTHILLDEGGALTETIQTPEIGGVAVLCEGGDNVKVAARIHEILSSLLGLSTGRISVTKMS